LKEVFPQRRKIPISDEIPEEDIFVLREIRKKFRRPAAEIISLLLVEVARAQASTKIGSPEKRIGVFGPYKKGGEDILHQVAQDF